jgi:mRNA-degrading endonuclease YafQ of YafQ-DinJ toxin-antitoxin module
MNAKTIYYTSKFGRNFRRLDRKVQIKAARKEKIFRQNPFDPRLKTHRLKGVWRDFYSFSVDYRYRIVFTFESRDKVTFVDIGDHSVYR